MTTSSEDVLQLVSHVRHKKADGSLYVMPERIGWMPNNKDSITVSIKYEDIKMQKISPEGKPKIQLQLVLHSNDMAPTFHFVNPKGPKAQSEDRNDVKEKLQHLLPRFKKKLSKDLEEKNRILSENPLLFQLYKELVTSQVITTEEFWTQFVPNRLSAIGSLKLGNASSNGSLRSLSLGQQAVGISPAFLSSLKYSGSNGINYNLNNDIIEAIFRTYPAVKRKHFENVPLKMSEKEFWMKFFQSHYFHRDIVLRQNDIFSDCARSDEIRLRQAVGQGIEDPFVDLTAFEDMNYLNKSEEAKDVNVTDGDQQPVKQKKRDRDRYDPMLAAPTNSNLTLIKRFNHFSIMVLDASLSKETNNTGSDSASSSIKSSITGGVSINGSLKIQKGTNGVKKASPSMTSLSPSPSCSSHYSMESVEEGDEIRRKRKRVEEHTALDDLNGILTADPNSWISQGAKQLNIRDKQLYMAGPTTTSVCDTSNGTFNYNHRNGRVSHDNVGNASRSQEQRLQHWNPSLHSALESPSALRAISELSPGGLMMKSTLRNDLKDTIPNDVQAELKNVYLACNELLRHFWACFPVTSESEEKLIQMKSTLEKFQYSKLQPLQNKLAKEHYNSDVSISINSKAFSYHFLCLVNDSFSASITKSFVSFQQLANEERSSISKMNHRLSFLGY